MRSIGMGPTAVSAVTMAFVTRTNVLDSTPAFGSIAEARGGGAFAMGAANDPTAVIGRIEIPRCSGLLPHRGCAIFQAKHGRGSAADHLDSERLRAASRLRPCSGVGQMGDSRHATS